MRHKKKPQMSSFVKKKAVTNSSSVVRVLVYQAIRLRFDPQHYPFLFLYFRKLSFITVGVSGSDSPINKQVRRLADKCIKMTEHTTNTK